MEDQIKTKIEQIIEEIKNKPVDTLDKNSIKKLDDKKKEIEDLIKKFKKDFRDVHANYGSEKYKNQIQDWNTELEEKYKPIKEKDLLLNTPVINPPPIINPPVINPPNSSSVNPPLINPPSTASNLPPIPVADLPSDLLKDLPYEDFLTQIKTGKYPIKLLDNAEKGTTINYLLNKHKSLIYCTEIEEKKYYSFDRSIQTGNIFTLTDTEDIKKIPKKDNFLLLISIAFTEDANNKENIIKFKNNNNSFNIKGSTDKEKILTTNYIYDGTDIYYITTDFLNKDDYMYTETYRNTYFKVNNNFLFVDQLEEVIKKIKVKKEAKKKEELDKKLLELKELDKTEIEEYIKLEKFSPKNAEYLKNSKKFIEDMGNLFKIKDFDSNELKLKKEEVIRILLFFTLPYTLLADPSVEDRGINYVAELIEALPNKYSNRSLNNTLRDFIKSNTKDSLIDDLDILLRGTFGMSGIAKNAYNLLKEQFHFQHIDDYKKGIGTLNNQSETKAISLMLLNQVRRAYTTIIRIVSQYGHLTLYELPKIVDMKGCFPMRSRDLEVWQPESLNEKIDISEDGFFKCSNLDVLLKEKRKIFYNNRFTNPQAPLIKEEYIEFLKNELAEYLYDGFIKTIDYMKKNNKSTIDNEPYMKFNIEKAFDENGNQKWGIYIKKVYGYNGDNNFTLSIKDPADKNQTIHDIKNNYLEDFFKNNPLEYFVQIPQLEKYLQEIFSKGENLSSQDLDTIIFENFKNNQKNKEYDILTDEKIDRYLKQQMENFDDLPEDEKEEYRELKRNINLTNNTKFFYEFFNKYFELRNIYFKNDKVKNTRDMHFLAQLVYGNLLDIYNNKYPYYKLYFSESFFKDPKIFNLIKQSENQQLFLIFLMKLFKMFFDSSNPEIKDYFTKEKEDINNIFYIKEKHNIDTDLNKKEEELNKKKDELNKDKLTLIDKGNIEEEINNLNKDINYLKAIKAINFNGF